jgi:hypothetical protein
MAERILVTLLERGGYRVTRLGIEEIFDEIKILSQKEYLALGLPESLRALPDILVADPEVSWAALVELKFRRRFDEETARELHSTLISQRKHWPSANVLVMIGEPFRENDRFHQDYIRFIKPQATESLLWRPDGYADEKQRMCVVWEALPTMASLFKATHLDGDDEETSRRRWDFFSNMDYITQALKELTKF